MPTGANLPGLFSEPGERLHLIKHRIKQRFLDLKEWGLPVTALLVFFGMFSDIGLQHDRIPLPHKTQAAPPRTQKSRTVAAPGYVHRLRRVRTLPDPLYTGQQTNHYIEPTSTRSASSAVRASSAPSKNASLYVEETRWSGSCTSC